jgi:signal transduction histidine kinase
MRGHLFWRFGLFVVLLVLFVSTALSVLAGIIVGLLGLEGTPLGLVGSRPVAVLFLIGLGILLVLRGVRRVTTPLGDMLEAIGRIADGDYTTRMDAHGSPEMRELARAVNRMTARLQTSDEQRRNLMADMAHELRTPLTLIQGNLEGVLDGVYPRDDAHLRLLLEETQWLSRLIDDLRTLALSESGALQLHKEPTDIGSVVRDVAQALQPQADAAGIRLAEQIPSDLARVQADPARIREVVMNLAANALRYTPQGGSVTFRVLADGVKQTVTVEVADTGAGIAPADLPRIFDRFYKSQESRGSGLGLAIARSLVVAHGGEISAESVPGKGTTIRFTLPAA